MVIGRVEGRQIGRHRGQALVISAVALVLAVSAASGSLAAAAVQPANPQPGDPLPACAYRQVTTRYTAYGDWKMTLLDSRERVSSDYVPPDLVSVGQADIAGSGRVRAVMIDDLRAMAAAARRAGDGIAVRSAYRSYADQAAVFRSWVRQHGYAAALLESARPGHSEHQLGLAIDFRSASSSRAPWDYPDWARTGPGRWMKNNAWQYGFIMSYPKGKTASTCYEYEPWHYRYVGRAEAAAVHASGEVLRRYLWDHFETAPEGS